MASVKVKAWGTKSAKASLAPVSEEERRLVWEWRRKDLIALFKAQPRPPAGAATLLDWEKYLRDLAQWRAAWRRGQKALVNRHAYTQGKIEHPRRALRSKRHKPLSGGKATFPRKLSPVERRMWKRLRQWERWARGEAHAPRLPRNAKGQLQRVE